MRHSLYSLLPRPLITLCLAFVLAGAPLSGFAADAQALQAKYRQLADQLAHSPFGSPLLLEARVNEGQAEGHVYALVATPLPQLAASLSRMDAWCEVALLHVNVKACTHDGGQLLQFYVGRKYYQTAEQAFALQYRFRLEQNDATALAVLLSAPDGPLGTDNYRIRLEAVAVDPQHSFLHFAYSYDYDWRAELALKTYLATLGRDKLGFTVTGHDAAGQPLYIQGLQGVIERNAMRYFLAIEAVLDSQALSGPARFEAQARDWFQRIEHFPRQLLETNLADYLEMKRREHAQQQLLQAAATAHPPHLATLPPSGS